MEQSSDDIWRAICETVRSVLRSSGIAGDDVAGISFDATCSLVALDRQDRPLTVDLEGDPRRNVIVWMDHRAIAQTEAINAGAHDVLKYVGGRLSPEMETPKLRWIKERLPDTWARAGKFFDLADYLTYRSTGIDARSLCTVVCKWTYLGHEGPDGRWDMDFLSAAGISDAFTGGCVPTDVRPMGSFLGRLTETAATDLGLTQQCAVGVGIIDAHAGGLGLLGAVWNGRDGQDPALLETALALIGGTSNCHMAVSSEPKFIDGIWGPYFGAMVPGMWLTEGGQSSAGSAIDHVIQDHANYPKLVESAANQGATTYQLLNAELQRLAADRSIPYSALLTRDIHVLPYFLGNRSPNADPHATAIIEGLTLDESITSQALRYYAVVQAVAYGTRDIVRAMNEAGYRIETMFVTGGGAKNPLWLQEHADATGLTLVLPREPEAVLLGSAILAATAAGIYPSIYTAMQSMSAPGKIVTPNPKTSATTTRPNSTYSNPCMPSNYAAASQCGPSDPISPRIGQFMTTPVILTTWTFGLPACRTGIALLRDGAAGLDAIEAAANITEDDPTVMSVGTGGLPNAEGVVELDAAIMDGATHSAGAVAALTDTARPISVARRVMERTRHVMLAGANAVRFGATRGLSARLNCSPMPAERDGMSGGTPKRPRRRALRACGALAGDAAVLHSGRPRHDRTLRAGQAWQSGRRVYDERHGTEEYRAASATPHHRCGPLRGQRNRGRGGDRSWR